MMRTHENITETPKSDLQTLLRHDHDRLDKLFEDLVAAFRADARDEAAQLWTAFDAGLLAHFDLEEKRVLPEFTKAYPVEAAALAREHTEIRALLDELGIGVDLHLTRADSVAHFVEVLKKHAKREDALMYRWARANLVEGDQATIRTQLLSFVRKLVGNTPRQGGRSFGPHRGPSHE